MASAGVRVRHRAHGGDAPYGTPAGAPGPAHDPRPGCRPADRARVAGPACGPWVCVTYPACVEGRFSSFHPSSPGRPGRLRVALPMTSPAAFRTPVHSRPRGRDRGPWEIFHTS